jgi:CRISPR-associated protein Cas1
MARSYYIFQSGRLRRKGNTLQLEKEDATASSAIREADDSIDKENGWEGTEALDEPNSETAVALRQEAQSQPSSSRRIIPIEDVAELFLFGEITMNTKLLNFLAQKGIPVHVFNYHGFYSGSYYPRETNVSGHLLVKQVEHYTDPAKRMMLAREFARGAYHHLHRNLLYYRNRGKALEEALEALEREGAEIERADSIAALMGAEGRMRETYYRAFNEILDLEAPFLKRVKRPPDNLINALLSFGNALLYAAVLSQIYRTPLNPTISYLHEPGARRFSLALDIAEIFKPMIVDKMIFALLNRQMIGDEDLIAEVGFAALKERARKLIVQEFERRLQTTVKHRRMGRNVSYRGFIRLECYKLVRHLLGIEPYRALRAWW